MKMTRRCWMFLLFGIAIGPFAAGPAHAAETLRLLIVDGQNNHNWKDTTGLMKDFLEATGRFTVDVATTPPRGASQEAWNDFRPRFVDYDVVLSNYNGELWPKPVQNALEKYVSAGGGLVIVHAANNPFPQWDEFNKMIGLGWRGAEYGKRLTLDDEGKAVITPPGEGPGAGHGPQHEFQVIVRNSDHPVMKGMPRKWMHAKDELYHGQRGPAERMHILATAYSAPDKGGTGAHEPMVWWIPYGRGQVFTTLMGHVGRNARQMPAMQCIGFQSVVKRGSEWAATGKVTLPIPENFPTATEVRTTGE